MGVFAVGQPYRRKEDDRFIIGGGRYGDDVNVPGQAYACFVRSPHAHARIMGIDSSEASAAPGVIAILTGKDMEAAGLGGMPCIAVLPGRNGGPSNVTPHRAALCVEIARHAGDPVAMVVATTWRQARDAADLVMVEYEELPLRYGRCSGAGPRCAANLAGGAGQSGGGLGTGQSRRHRCGICARASCDAAAAGE